MAPTCDEGGARYFATGACQTARFCPRCGGSAVYRGGAAFVAGHQLAERYRDRLLEAGAALPTPWPWDRHVAELAMARFPDPDPVVQTWLVEQCDRAARGAWAQIVEDADAAVTRATAPSPRRGTA